MTCSRDGEEAGHVHRDPGAALWYGRGPTLLRQDRASPARYPGDRGVRGDRLCRELVRYRALWPQQAGLAADVSGAAERHPSHDTFRRVFMLIDPDTFETGFTAWSARSQRALSARWSPSTVRRSGARSTMGGINRRCT